ncbi:mechanosensitive ion channel family protein [Crenobacter cavernae]|nr:mechanosensitive ion channel domain-containing protein [Crenobacter cavernae]
MTFRHIFIILCAALVALPALAASAEAAEPADAAAAHEERTLRVANREVFTFAATVFGLGPEERSERAGQRIRALPPDDLLAPVVAQPLTFEKETGVAMMHKGVPLFTVYRSDLDPVESPPLDKVAAEVRTRLQDALAARHEQGSAKRLAIGTALAAAATVALAIALIALYRSQRRLLAVIDTKLVRLSNRHLLNWRVLLLGAERYLLIVSAAVSAFALVYLWLAFALAQFPYTAPWGARLGQSMVSLGERLAGGAIDALPGLVTVLVIFALTRFAARGLTLIFDAVESGRLALPGLHPETVGATRRLTLVVLWLFALTVAYPYLPGSQSDAFKGVSVFLGLMVTLGSAGIVNQAMNGLVLVYSRALKNGDYVVIGDVEGTVSELGPLSTKLVTRNDIEVTVPNSVITGGKIVNASRLAEGRGMPVTTTVTIGYDTPWRQVHAMLELAARRTNGLREDAPPKVRQTALQDFYVAYELMVRLADGAGRADTLTLLHGHIQDVFNEFGVQIMSPNFEAQPHQPVLSPPESWYASPAKQPEHTA